jgi:hypothetical protein
MIVKIQFFLLLLLIILTGCTTPAVVVKPQPNISQCKYCVGVWQLVCVDLNSPYCEKFEWQCSSWNFLECRDDYPTYYYRATPGHTYSSSLEVERVLDSVFGNNRKTLSLKELSAKVDGLSFDEINDFNNNGGRLTNNQIQKLAKQLNTDSNTIREIYENRIIIAENSYK